MLRRFSVVLTLLALFTGLALAQTTLTFWTSSTFPIDVEAQQAIVDAFNDSNDDLQVVMVQVPGEDVTDVAKLMTAVAGGTGPDIYMLDRFTVAQRASSGLLTPLGEHIDVARAQSYVDYAWEEVQFDNQVWGVPFDTDVRALYYNKDMLSAAGIDPAELDRSNGPITTARAMEIGMAVNQTDEAGNYTQVGFMPWVGQGQPYTWGFAFGGDFYDEEACQITPTEPSVVASMQYVYDFAATLDPTRIQNFISTFSSAAGPIAWSGQIPPAQNPFITGRLGMIVTGDWFVANMERYAPAIDYGVTYIPTPDGSVSSWSGGWAMVVPTGTEDVSAAMRFVDFITGEEGQRIYTGETSHLPTWRSLLDEEDLYDGERAFLRTLLEGSNSRPPLPIGGMYWGELRGAQENVVLNRMTAGDALERVFDRVQPRLEEYCN